MKKVLFGLLVLGIVGFVIAPVVGQEKITALKTIDSQLLVATKEEPVKIEPVTKEILTLQEAKEIYKVPYQKINTNGLIIYDDMQKKEMATIYDVIKYIKETPEEKRQNIIIKISDPAAIQRLRDYFVQKLRVMALNEFDNEYKEVLPGEEQLVKARAIFQDYFEDEEFRKAAIQIERIVDREIKEQDTALALMYMDELLSMKDYEFTNVVDKVLAIPPEKVLGESVSSIYLGEPMLKQENPSLTEVTLVTKDINSPYNEEELKKELDLARKNTDDLLVMSAIQHIREKVQKEREKIVIDVGTDPEYHLIDCP